MNTKYNGKMSKSACIHPALMFPGRPRGVNIREVFYLFSFFLNIVHIYAVSDTYVITGPLEYLVWACLVNSQVCFVNSQVCFVNSQVCFDNSQVCFDNSQVCFDNNWAWLTLGVLFLGFVSA